jgi:hypothetical protein
VAQKHAKLCMDPNSLVRKGVFGGTALFDSRLQEQVGFMDIAPLRAMFAEHCLAPGSSTAFTPPNLGLVCTPKGEFAFVVGEDGIDQKEWKLKPGASPTLGPDSMVEGRNTRTIDELLAAPEAKGLLPEEIIALRLCSGPMHYVYNDVLRDLDSGHGTRNTFPTTIALAISGIRKLGAVNKAPDDGAVFRGLSGLALPREFFELDEQGFAGGVEPSFMATTHDETVARKYSSGAGEYPTIFKLLLGKMSLGADISWLSQFAGEAEMLFPPRTHLQLVDSVLGDDGVAVVTLRPTTVQNISIMEEVMSSRKEGLQQLASSLTWDLRNEADRDNEFTPEFAQRIDQLEKGLASKYCKQDDAWYSNNIKYKQAFQGLVHEVIEARKHIRDITSALCKGLANGSGQVDEVCVATEDMAPSSANSSTQVMSSSSEVSELHSKFIQDPNFKGVRGTFGSDRLFAAGLDAVVGPMDGHYVRAMFNEHNTAADAHSGLTAWNAGHKIVTTPQDEWLFVVGREGLDRGTWTLNPAQSVPHVLRELEAGRNAKRLADLLDTPEAQEAGLLAAEVVALRLYTGPSMLTPPPPPPSPRLLLVSVCTSICACNCVILQHE